MQPNFIIPISELVSGRAARKWHADGKFFEAFENSEIHEASLDVDAAVVRNGSSVKATVSVNGSVTVSCDRCLADLTLPVEVSDTEDVPISQDSPDIDLSQTVYDFVCTALPIVRVHPEGECDPRTVGFLCDGVPQIQEESSENPFASLKDMLNDK